MRVRWNKITVLFIIFTFVFTVAPFSTSTVSADPPLEPASSWYNTSWAYSKKITIDHTKVAATLTNFPVLVYRTDDNFKHAQSDGDDFVFTSADNNTKYNHEIERWSSSNGELVAWVNITSLSSTTDTVLYIYYGNPSCSSQQNKAGTWNSNYKVVYHMNDLTTSTILDSTSNSNNGTKTSANNPTEANAKMGKGQIFAGDDYITKTITGMSGVMTVSGWVYTTGTATQPRIINFACAATAGLDVGHRGSTNPSAGKAWVDGNAYANTNSMASTTTVNDGTWHYVIVVKSTTTQYDLYVDDGAAEVTEAGTNSVFSRIFIGERQDGSSLFTGTLDEIRISNTNRNASWISTEYKNQNSPSSFMSFGCQNPTVAWYNTSWAYSQKITIDHTKVAGALTNFPVLISKSIGPFVYAAGATTLTVRQLWSPTMAFNRETASYGNTITCLLQNDTYIYAAGAGSSPNRAVRKYWKTNMTQKSVSGDYGGVIYALARDDTYIYAGGATTNKVYKYWASNMTKKAETVTYGGTINSIVVDDTYIYVGGASTQKVYQYWKSNMTKTPRETAVYTGSINAIVIDGTYLYAAGQNSTTAANTRIKQYWLSNFTKKAEATTIYGGWIETMVQDTNYLYIGGQTTNKVYQYWKSNLTKKADAAYGGEVIAVANDGTYLYAAGATTQKVYQYWLSNMTKKAETGTYGGTIYALCVDAYTLLKAQLDGDDFVFVSQDNDTKYNHEIERWTGELNAWVNITILSNTTDTIIYMYYGNPTCSNQQNHHGTWNSDYVAVMHMNGASYTAITDSTSNHNNVTTQSGTPAFQKAGRVGYCVQTGSGYLVTGTPVRNTCPITVEVWANNIATGYYILSNGAENTPYGFTIDDDAGKYYMDMKIAANNYRTYYSAGTFPSGSWQFLGLRWDGTTGTNKGVFNPGSKSLVYHTPVTTTGTAGANLHIGVNEYFKNYQFNGYIDEIRISKVVRSNAWMNATYDSINSPSTFTTFGPEQEPTLNQAPNTPTGLAPHARQTTTSVNIYAIATDPESNAMTLYFYNNATKVEISHTSITSGQNGSVSWSGLTRGTTYTFYARAYDGSLWGSNSSTCSFTVNSLPVCTGFMTENLTDPTRITNTSPYFNWTFSDTDSDTQTKYKITVGTTNNSDNMWNSTEVTSANNHVNYAGSTLSRGTLYYVRVSAYDGYNWSDWKHGTFQLNKLSNAPSDPLCESQVNPTKILTSTPTFSWTFTDDDAGDTQGGFNIIVGTSSGDDSLWNYTTASGTSSVVYAGSALNRGTTYHWKVRTYDNHETTKGPFCGDQTFKINSLPAINLVSPDNLAIGIQLSPAMSWSYSDADADVQSDYHLQISKYSAFNSTVLDRNFTSSAASYVLTTPLINATKYYWRAKVKDGNEWSAWTATWSFNTTNITVKDLTTYTSAYLKTSSFSINNKVVIQYNVTNIQNMNNTYITIEDPDAVKRVDHQGVSSVQDAFTSDSNWNEDYANRWNIVSNQYQHGANGGSSQYGAYSLIKESVLANQTDVTITVKTMIDFSNEDMERILVRWTDANNYVCGYISETYSVIGIEEKVAGVRYFEQTSRLFSEDTWYTLKFAVEGDTAHIYVDDALLVTKTRLTNTGSGRIGLGTDTGWIYFDDFSVGYPDSRVVGTIPNGYKYEFNYTIPNNVSLVGTWTITASAESGGQTSQAQETFDVLSEPPVVQNITTYNSTYVETASFLDGDKVVTRAWIADSDGRTAITECNITIKNPLGTTKIDKIDMTDVGDITNGNIYEYNYTIPHETASQGNWVITIKTHDNESHSAIDNDTFSVNVGAPDITVIKTYDASALAETLFSVGETMKIRATVTDANGRGNISHCNVTIIAPNGTKIVTNATMTDIGDVTNGNIYNYDYVLPTTTESFGTWAIIIRTCDVFYTTSESSHFVLEWADVKYYHRTRISLTENFSQSRTHEPMGFKITLPSAVNTNSSTMRLVNEKGETMPFSILKTSGTTYYLNYVANITADESIDYYIYYNITGTAPTMYQTFATASNDNLTLAEANYTQVYAPLTQNITYGKSVIVRDVDNDGQKEIIWAGRNGPTLHNKAFLAIYNATFSDNAVASLQREAYIEWNYSGYGESFAYSVNTSDLDSDGIIEIITGGATYNGTKNMAQLCIWNYTGGVIHLEKESTWSDTAVGDTAIYGVITMDADGDGVKEILTAGTTGTALHRGQFGVHNYTGGLIKHEYFSNWSLSPNTYNWTEFYAITAGDIYNDANIEVIVGGDGFADGGKINAVFKVYRYYTGAWHVDDTQNWAQQQLSEIFSMAIGDVNNDGKNEWVTSGNYFDGTRDIAQYRVWNATGAGYPKTLGEIEDMRKSWYVYGYSSALTTLITDIDKNQLNEIITVGFQNDNVVDRGDYKIRYWDGTTRELYSQLWEHEYARRSGDFFDAAYISDLNNDGFYELIDTGRYALTPPAGTYLRVQSVGGINQTVHTTADNHGQVLPPYPPVAGTVQKVTANHTDTSIGFTWTKASDANTTVIVYKKGSYPTSVTDGTVGYNSTGSAKNVTGLDAGTKYYFSFFSYRTGSGEYSKEWRQSNDSTNPGAPTDFNAKDPTSNSINLSWTKGTNATTTYIVRKEGSYPVNITDGTFIYNDTGVLTTDNNGLAPVTTYYYRAWSYNVDSDYFSLGYDDDSETTLMESPTVVTNESTSVEETSATLHGYLDDDGGDACTVGFYYDTTTGGTTNNVSLVGTYTTGQEFGKGITSLTKGELYYFTAWANNSGIGSFIKASNEKKLLTKSDAPTGLTGSHEISLTWTEATCGAGETLGTRIQYNTTSYPTEINDIDSNHNTTDESAQVGVSSDTKYYFSAWTWVKAETNDLFKWSDAYITFNTTSAPSPPTDVTANASMFSINITWSKAKSSYNTILVRNESGYANYPTTITNGTLLYNGSLAYYNDADVSLNIDYYYSLWSYNGTTKLYSAYETVSNQTTMLTWMGISITPTATDFGLVPLGFEAKTTGKHYNLTNLGMNCDVSMQFNSSQNWTASTFAQWGYNKFAMNWSDNNWANQTNINPISGAVLKTNMTYLQYFLFDLKLLTPTASSTLHEQNWVMTFVVTAS